MSTLQVLIVALYISLTLSDSETRALLCRWMLVRLVKQPAISKTFDVKIQSNKQVNKVLSYLILKLILTI